MLSGLGAYDELPRSPLMLMVKSMPGPCGLVEPEGLIGLDPQPSPSARTAISEPTVIIRIMKDAQQTLSHSPTPLTCYKLGCLTSTGPKGIP
jgi:hypothetical protein